MSDYIPNELLAEILVRLPVQSLLRFTSVCKSWCSLITSPSFIAEHLNHSKTNTESLLLKTCNFDRMKDRYLFWRGDEKLSGEFSELKSPFSCPVGYKTIVGSCNGLLCLVDSSSSPSMILWNPSIRKSVNLPMPHLPQTSLDTFVLGFGAHPTTQEYILLLIGYEKADLGQRTLPSKVKLYTQGTRSWRSVTSVGYPPHVSIFNCFQTSVNGAIHWIAYDNRVVDGFHSLILLFNMGSQAFSVMMMPAALVNQCPVGLAITSYGESVAVLCNVGLEESSCALWSMKEYRVEESWAKLYSFSFPMLLRNIIGFRRNGEILVSTFDDRLLFFDCEAKALTNTRYTGSADGFSASTFMESLVLVKPGNGSCRGS